MRSLLSVSAVAVLCALVGAQSTRTVSPLEQQRLLKRNAVLVRELVDQSLSLSKQRSSLDRVASCRRLVGRFATEVSQAADAKEPGRAVEMGRHLDKLLVDAVVPNLKGARSLIKPGSLDEGRLIELRDGILADVRPLPGAARARSREVDEVMTMLRGALDRVAEAGK